MKRLPVASLLLVLLLAGCKSWRPSTVSPRQLIEEQQPERILLVQAGGRQLDVGDPRVEGDSITAVVRGRRVLPAESSGVVGRRAEYEDTIRVALADVTGVKTRHLSVGRTFAVILTPPAAFLVLVILYCGNQQCH
jgi:hypothetical protein